jgi:hypothetical protein
MAYHLICERHFTEDEAIEVVRLFGATEFGKETLKHAWTDYILKRQHRKSGKSATRSTN